jgi:hypothetical protein
MKTILRFRSFVRLIALLFVLLPAILAGPQQILRPIRVSISTEKTAESDDDQEFHRLFKGELNRLKSVAIVSAARADYDIFLTTNPVTKDNRVIGYCVAALVIAGKYKPRRVHLYAVAGPTLEEVASRIVSQLNEDLFANGGK